MRQSAGRALLATLLMGAGCLAVQGARADFIGTLELLPPGCEATGECRLGQDFGFVDAAGIGWQAAKGLITDGASIPSWAKPFIGQSFEPAFIRAAVIHDHYCVRNVRPWRQTHKVFHEALLKSGVSPVQAGVMYYAVLVGGPKWAKLVKGKPCPVGAECVKRLDVTALVRGGSVNVTPESGLIIQRPAEFGSARFQKRMDDGVPQLLAAGNALNAAQVEELAKKAMAEDFYFQNGDEIGTSLSIKLEEQ